MVWGEAFRNYLTDYQFRSLLAPGNLPADVGREKRMLICGPREDWDALDRHPVMAEVRKHATVEWIEFEPARHRQIRSMAIGMAMCLKHAKACNGYIAFFPPDSIYCNDAVTQMEEWIQEGLRLVLVPAFRCEESAILSALDLKGGDTTPIDRKAIDINAAVVGSLHSQMLVTDIDADFLFSRAHVFHIRAADQSWMVAKSMAWANAVMDLSHVPDEILDEAARSVLDSYIVAKMFPSLEHVRFIATPDDYAMVSWAPSDWSALPTRGHWLQRPSFIKRIYNDYVARKALGYHLVWEKREDDWIKRYALLNVTVMFGDQARHGTQMHAAGQRLESYLRRAAPDLLHIGPANAYLRLLDILDSTLRKFRFIANALVNRDNGRARLTRRLQALIEKISGSDRRNTGAL